MADVTLQERLEEATADLSRCQVASDVAEILRVEGVQGEPHEERTCPLACLLGKRLGVSVTVNGDVVWAHPQPPHAGRAARLDLPPAARAFVARFDEHAYPELQTARTDCCDDDYWCPVCGEDICGD